MRWWRTSALCLRQAAATSLAGRSRFLLAWQPHLLQTGSGTPHNSRCGADSMSLTRRVFLERIAQIGGYSAAFRTMQVLGLTPTASASALPALTADFGKGKRVVILGCGIAGLVSAYELCKAGFECTILEAR